MSSIAASLAYQAPLTKAEINAATLKYIGFAAVAFGVFLSGFVINEPAPYDLYMVAIIGVAFLCGLRLNRIRTVCTIDIHLAASDMPFKKRARQILPGSFSVSWMLGVRSQRTVDTPAAVRRSPIGRDRKPGGVASTTAKVDRADDRRAATDTEIAGLVDCRAVGAG